MENRENMELNKDELEKVTGGAGGNIPPEGIRFTRYEGFPKPGFYYSFRADEKTFFVYCVTEISNPESPKFCRVYHTRERFTVKDGKWSTIVEESTSSRLPEFNSTYVFEMNIHP